jgi:hypothetical protein
MAVQTEEKGTMEQLWNKMQEVALSTGHFVKLTLYSDGSGSLEHDGSERRFSRLELALFYVNELIKKGYMS